LPFYEIVKFRLCEESFLLSIGKRAEKAIKGAPFLLDKMQKSGIKKMIFFA
jgi:hypothetical protein